VTVRPRWELTGHSFARYYVGQIGNVQKKCIVAIGDITVPCQLSAFVYSQTCSQDSAVHFAQNREVSTRDLNIASLCCLADDYGNHLAHLLDCNIIKVMELGLLFSALPVGVLTARGGTMRGMGSNRVELASARLTCKQVASVMLAPAYALPFVV